MAHHLFSFNWILVTLAWRSFHCLMVVFIQNMKMVPVPAQGFANFFEGDCYIVLYVSKVLVDFPREYTH